MGLKESLGREPVSRLHLREAIKASPDLPISKAIEVMRRKRLGCAVIVDDADRPLGVFTERDIIRILVEDPSQVDVGAIGDHMSDKCAIVREDDPSVAVIAAMQVSDIRFVVVTDAQGRVKALTGQRGVMEFVAEHYPSRVMNQTAGERSYSDNREGA